MRTEVIVARVRRAVGAVTRENEFGEWLHMGGKTTIGSGRCQIVLDKVPDAERPIMDS